MFSRLQKLLPQGSQCGGCGKQLWEWKRHPCPYCGGMRRNIGRFTRETLMQEDRVGSRIKGKK